jgi:hypothetical protein
VGGGETLLSMLEKVPGVYEMVPSQEKKCSIGGSGLVRRYYMEVMML